MTSLLSIQNAVCCYEQTTVLDGVSIELETGQLCALLGPSGCGKTTLLRTIAGFHPLAEGTLILDGKDISHLQPDRRGIGFVFQDYALFPHMTIADNIAFGLSRQGDWRARVQEMLTLVNLNGFDHRYPHELSGGQQQRVALARALAPAPKLLLLDEPFSNLDTELRKSLSLNVRDILKSTGTGAILVTHDQSEAFAFGDAVGILNQAHLEQFSTPYQLYHTPSTRFVAQFVGQGTLINAQLNSHQQFDTEFGSIPFPATTETQAQVQADLVSQPVELLSRPDDWLINPDNKPDRTSGTPVAVIITHKQFAGTQTLHHVRAASGNSLSIAVPSHQNHDIGETVTIEPAFKHIIYFQ
ncbi:Sulfate/thiosulfate import ATP-binding protein CysA [BD1-7 clade bacterium]|nr:Sulfate/thiosulfate import ATP-binding protein CysA [BD1-7 clade bacterium]